MKDRKNNHQAVYSSEYGRLCPACERPEKNCICKQQQSRPAGDGILRVSRETKGRKGKGVTLVSGVPDALLPSLAKEMKQRCGSGGTVKEGLIEIQGDHRDILLSWLLEKGYKAKKAGG